MSKHLFPNKILWLASYPKSGNTWFRAFLTALFNDGEVDINYMASEGIFSSREIFDVVSDIDSRDLYSDEAKLMIADVYRFIAAENNSLSIIKIHDAFTMNPTGENLIPEDVTHCAVYFIRNPLDIAGSLANHLQSGIQHAIEMINSTNSFFSEQPHNLNNGSQFRQYLSDWSGHVNSWTLKPSFPVYVVRYEDMLTNTFETFTKIVESIGWQYPASAILKAIEATSFNKLSSQESEKGFRERPDKNIKFFRIGKMNNWKKELSEKQIKEIISTNEKILKKYHYI